MQRYENPDDDVSNEYNLMCIEEGNDENVDQSAPKKKLRKIKEEIVQRFVFFDLETTQEKEVRESKLGQEIEHVPNVVVAMITCYDCRHRDFETPCNRCGDHKRVFTGKNCIDDFCRFQFNKKWQIRLQLLTIQIF